MILYEFEGKRPQYRPQRLYARQRQYHRRRANRRGEAPDGKIAVGIPARIIGDVTAEHKAEGQHYKDEYAELAATRYPARLKRIG